MSRDYSANSYRGMSIIRIFGYGCFINAFPEKMHGIGTCCVRCHALWNCHHSFFQELTPELTPPICPLKQVHGVGGDHQFLVGRDDAHGDLGVGGGDDFLYAT